MKQHALLRLASLVAFLQFLGHGYLHITSIPVRDAVGIELVEKMKSHQFLVQGNTRTLWDFYFGYGLFAAVNCLIESILFLQLSCMVVGSATGVRGVTCLFLIANIVYIILSLNYFFMTPVIFDSAIAIILALSLKRTAISNRSS